VGVVNEDDEHAVQDFGVQTEGNEERALPALVYVVEPLPNAAYDSRSTQEVASSSTTTTTKRKRLWQPARSSVLSTEDEQAQSVASRPSGIRSLVRKPIKVAPYPDADGPYPATAGRLDTATISEASTSSSGRTTVADLVLMLPDIQEGGSASNARPAYVYKLLF
jgi:hypothetical protein